MFELGRLKISVAAQNSRRERVGLAGIQVAIAQPRVAGSRACAGAGQLPLARVGMCEGTHLGMG